MLPACLSPVFCRLFSVVRILAYVLTLYSNYEHLAGGQDKVVFEVYLNAPIVEGVIAFGRLSRRRQRDLGRVEILRHFKCKRFQRQSPPAKLNLLKLRFAFAFLAERTPALSGGERRAEVVRRDRRREAKMALRPVILVTGQGRIDAPACKRPCVVVAAFDLVERVVLGRVNSCEYVAKSTSFYLCGLCGKIF